LSRFTEKEWGGREREREEGVESEGGGSWAGGRREHPRWENAMPPAWFLEHLSGLVQHWKLHEKGGNYTHGVMPGTWLPLMAVLRGTGA
jgi:hypothetical protein